jgi:hypothetical protein
MGVFGTFLLSAGLRYKIYKGGRMNKYTPHTHLIGKGENQAASKAGGNDENVMERDVGSGVVGSGHSGKSCSRPGYGP